MAEPRPIVVDFETEAIEPRPDYPPRPVGVALRVPGRGAEYLAWGHPEGNNCTLDDARRRLAAAWADPQPKAFHNAKFDVEVAHVHLGLPYPSWDGLHDSMLLAFLADPYARSLELKPLAEKLLGEPPTERDELRDWIVANVPEARAAKQRWGRYVCRAPARLVAPYAIGDVARTDRLTSLLLPRIKREGMTPPYERERRLIEILCRNERIGMSVDLERLRADVAAYGACLQRVDAWIGKRLRARDLDVDKREQLADAIDRAGLARGGWLLTPSGERSTSREALERAISDRILLAALAYRASLATCLRTFMRPWLDVAERTGGRVHTTWRSTRDDAEYGARTGRLSSTPNLQNIPVEFEDEARTFQEVRFFEHAPGLLPLPLVRSYVVAGSKKRVLCGRDYNSQELRVLAHYEDGVLADKYRAEPRADVHRFVADMIVERFGVDLGPNPRKTAKTLNFLKVYGGGAPKLAVKLGVSIEQAQAIMRAYEAVFPDLNDLNKDLKARGRANEPIRTLGGRLYRAEPPRIVKNQLRSFEYKLLNYLVQGSSADMTKEAVVRHDADRGDARLVLTVHDEILIDAPKRGWRAAMAKLKTAMESIALDVPLLSDGEMGDRWTEMKEVA